MLVCFVLSCPVCCHRRLKLITARSSSDLPAAGAQSRWLSENTLRLRFGIGLRGRDSSQLGTWNLELGTFGASAPLSADTAPPRRTLSSFVYHSQRLSQHAQPFFSCPTFPYASASRARKYGWLNSAPVALGSQPWRICAIPSSPCPCSASAQPRR